MNYFEPNKLEKLFQSIGDCIPATFSKARTWLEYIKPAQHEANVLEWRYRLDGYMKGLMAADVIDEAHQESISKALLGTDAPAGKRAGRDHKYSVDIETECGFTHSFDVPSMNACDAYFQLTKRMAYKAIPDIARALVFHGTKSDRDSNSTPARTFEEDELVYVSLI